MRWETELDDFEVLTAISSLWASSYCRDPLSLSLLTCIFGFQVFKIFLRRLLVFCVIMSSLALSIVYLFLNCFSYRYWNKKSSKTAWLCQGALHFIECPLPCLCLLHTVGMGQSLCFSFSLLVPTTACLVRAAVAAAVAAWCPKFTERNDTPRR